MNKQPKPDSKKKRLTKLERENLKLLKEYKETPSKGKMAKEVGKEISKDILKWSVVFILGLVVFPLLFDGCKNFFN